MLRTSSSLLPPPSTCSNLPNQQIFEDWLLLNANNNNNSNSSSSSSNNNNNKTSSSVHGFITHHQKSNDATIRIFISSTFSDMSKERDLIATRVAPRVNKFSESLGITTTFVDLRWGVTTEQTEANDTVSVCLDQVLKSDIMIVFCGHRYGWHVCDDVNNNDNNNNETDETTDQDGNNRKRRGVGRLNEKNDLLTKSILHAAEALSTEEMKWLQPVLALANHNNHKKNHNETFASSSSASSLLTAKLLIRSSVTELEIRAAFMKERFLNSNIPKNNNDVNPNKSNIHIFLRTQSLKSETEDCEVARSRLNALRNALSVLPNAKKYDNLSKNNNNSSVNQTSSDYSSSSSSSTGIIIKNSNSLEEEIFKAICESIFNVFPDRRGKEKPRKWEREGQIQQVLADRSLQGFCEDF